LHVEDDSDVRQVVALMFADVADLTAADCLREARRRLEEEVYDLVILDLTLPDGSGLDLVPYLTRPSGQVIPVVLFSAREVTADVARRVDAALVKTRTSNEQLLETITALIRRGSPLVVTP
jgi:DNA-binding response OmpR family regulator